MNPEQSARQLIDGKLTQAGWLVQDRKDFKRLFASYEGKEQAIWL